jgi:hypothetical protein
MLPIQDATPTSIFDNIHLTTIKEWELCLGGKLIAIPFDPDARYLEAHESIRSRILTAVAEIVSAQEISVAAPKLSEEADSKNRSPTSFLIYNISTKQADTLLVQKVWSSKSISFQVVPFAAGCPTFLFSIKTLTTTMMGNIFDMVKAVWQSQNTKDFISMMLLDIPACERGKATTEIDNFLESMSILCLDIKVTGNSLDPHFNVYTDSSILSDDRVWTTLCSYLFAAAYIAKLQGCTATDKIPFRCSLCHSIDHPRGLCPFPNLPGWNGPKRDYKRGDQ